MSLPSTTADEDRTARLALSHALGHLANDHLIAGYAPAQILKSPRGPALLGHAGRRLFARVTAVDSRTLLQRAGGTARFIVPSDDEFPDSLLDLRGSRPLGLWVRGETPLADLARGAYAFIGPTIMSERGTATAEDFGAGLARAGHTVIAHLGRAMIPPQLHGALSEGGRVIAVLRHGIDDTGGATSAAYAAAMQSVLAHGGVVISAAPWGARRYDSMKADLAERERRWNIMTALASSVLVVEGNRRQIRVRTPAASPMERTWLAFPGGSSEYLAELPNHLLRSGQGHLVRTLADILNPLPEQIQIPHPRPSDPDTDWRDQAVLSWMAQARARGLRPTQVGAELWDGNDEHAGTVAIGRETYELVSDRTVVRAVAAPDPDSADHSGCFLPHRDSSGEYVDCDGRPL
jgi:DNA processing protein